MNIARLLHSLSVLILVFFVSSNTSVAQQNADNKLTFVNLPQPIGIIAEAHRYPIADSGCSIYDDGTSSFFQGPIVTGKGSNLLITGARASSWYDPDNTSLYKSLSSRGPALLVFSTNSRTSGTVTFDYNDLNEAQLKISHRFTGFTNMSINGVGKMAFTLYLTLPGRPECSLPFVMSYRTRL